jgi:hypothetical protein
MSSLRSLPLNLGRFFLVTMSGCSPLLDWATERGHDVPRSCIQAPSVAGDSPDAHQDRMTLPETDVRVTVPMDVDGIGDDFIGAVALEGGVGQIEIGCEHVAAAVYAMDVSSDWTTLSVMAVAPERLYPIWLYCSTSDDRLLYAVYTGTDGTPFTTELASGHCSSRSSAGERAHFPAFDVPPPPPFHGYTIDGPELSLTKDGLGSIVVGGVRLLLLPFGDLDCSSGCDSNFRDLHALVWDPNTPRLSFTTLRLRPHADTILLWSITLPEFVDTIGTQELAATFTTP